MVLIDESKKKLHSEKGSSILIALLLFFVCLLLSMSILSASVANRVRIKDERKRSQDFLKMESAVKILEEGLGNIKYYRREIIKKEGFSEANLENEEDRNCLDRPYSWVKVDGAFDGEKLGEKLQVIVDERVESLESQDNQFSIYLEGSEDKVYVRPQVDENYYLAFYINIKREDGSDDSVYKISYSPKFEAIEEVTSEAMTTGDAGWYEYSTTFYTRREFCVTWKKDFCVLQRVVN